MKWTPLKIIHFFIVLTSTQLSVAQIIKNWENIYPCEVLSIEDFSKTQKIINGTVSAQSHFKNGYHNEKICHFFWLDELSGNRGIEIFISHSPSLEPNKYNAYAKHQVNKRSDNGLPFDHNQYFLFDGNFGIYSRRERCIGINFKNQIVITLTFDEQTNHEMIVNEAPSLLKAVLNGLNRFYLNEKDKIIDNNTILFPNNIKDSLDFFDPILGRATEASRKSNCQLVENIYEENNYYHYQCGKGKTALKSDIIYARNKIISDDGIVERPIYVSYPIEPYHRRSIFDNVRSGDSIIWEVRTDSHNQQDTYLNTTSLEFTYHIYYIDSIVSAERFDINRQLAYEKEKSLSLNIDRIIFNEHNNFIKDVSKFIETPYGIRYKILEKGSGDMITENNYFIFNLAEIKEGVIEENRNFIGNVPTDLRGYHFGLSKALSLLSEGSKACFYIPSKLKFHAPLSNEKLQEPFENNDSFFYVEIVKVFSKDK